MTAVVRAFLGFFFWCLLLASLDGVRATDWERPLDGQLLYDGTPLTLLKNGEWQLGVMRGMRIDPEDVMAAARTKGMNSIFDVSYAILERNGAISIIKAQK